MAIQLPLTPTEATYILHRPRRQTRSEFSGFVQQILTGPSYHSGEFRLPPILRGSGDFARWTAFFAQVADDDSTFWIPLYNPDYTADQVWVDVVRADALRYSHPSFEGLAPGTLMQFRSPQANAVSFVRPIVERRNTQIKIGEALPLRSDTILEATATGAQVRALLIAEDANSATAQPHYLDTVSIAWQEAVGHILRDAGNIGLDRLLAEDGTLILTERDDPITLA